MTDVFISYKKEDLPRIEPIARALANAGYEVWWDHRIPAGRSYRDVIGAALQTAKCVIVVWSKLSAQAQWVLDEADEGKRRGVLLPLMIDAVEIPYGFRQIEAASLIGWSGDTTDSEWQNALSAVAHFVGRPPGGPPVPFVAPHAPKVADAPAKPKGKRGLVIGGALAALIVTLWLVLVPRMGSIGDSAVPEAYDEIVYAEDGQIAVPEVSSDPVSAPPPAAGQSGPVLSSVPPLVESTAIVALSCVSGYVWREAKTDDYVCVTPASRARVREENALAASRVDPYGAYGPASCLQGYVWREAYDGDLVCVPPEIRGLVADENRLAASRTAKP